MIEQETNIIEQPRFSSPKEFVRKRAVRRQFLQKDLDEVFCGELRRQILEIPDAMESANREEDLNEVELTTEQKIQDILNVIRLN